MNRILLPAGLLLVAALWLPSAPAADPPRVDFDVAYLLACHDVTPTGFATAHPNERLVEAVFNISALLHNTCDAELAQFFYRIESPHKSLRVADHLPRTELATPFVGPVSVEQSQERHASGGAGAGLAVPYGALLKADASLARGWKSEVDVRYQFLPPQELVAASGTLHRERGVYFKLKPSAQTSLEGSRQFVCVFRVPKSWRGDIVRVRCEALGRAGSAIPYFDAPPRLGAAEFLIGLYLEGDTAAQQAVQELAACEELLLETIAKYHGHLARQLRENSVPGYAHVRAWFRPPAPSELQLKLLERQRTGEAAAWPREVQQAVADLASALENVRKLSR